MTRKYCSTLLHDTAHDRRPDWRTLEQTQTCEVLYDSQRKRNDRAPFPKAIKTITAFTYGIPAALFTPQHQLFSKGAYSLVVFDGSPDATMLRMLHGPFVASCFKLDAVIIDQMAALYWAYEMLQKQARRYDLINEALDEITQQGMVSAVLRSNLASVEADNSSHQKILHDAADEVLLKLKDLFSSGWS